MSTLREAFIETLKDAYDAEHQILKALPNVIEMIEDDGLRNTVEAHIKETQEHAKRLEQVFEILGESPKRKECKGMAGLIAEGEEAMAEEEGDAALVLTLQKVEHYEIATYGALVSWAKLMDEEKAASILEKTLTEEIDTDEKLTDIAMVIINIDESGGKDQREAA